MSAVESPKEVSSRRRLAKKGRRASLGDPRFFNGGFNPLSHYKNYSFIYEREKEKLREDRLDKDKLVRIGSKVEARERFLNALALEKERRSQEEEMVKRGKKPFYPSAKHKKAMYEATFSKSKKNAPGSAALGESK